MQYFKKVALITIKQLDYFLLVLLLLFKVYYFGKLIDTVFITLPPLEYLMEFIKWIFGFSSSVQLTEGLVMISLGTILLATFWVLLLPTRQRLLAIVLLNLVLSFVILADAVYYRYFNDIISVTVLMQLKQIGDVGQSISALFNWTDILFILDVLITLPVVIYFYIKTRNQKNKVTSNIYAKIVLGIVVFVIGFQLTFIPFNKSMENGGAFQFNKLISNMRVYNFTGLLGFHGANSFRYINDNFINKQVYTEEEILAAQEWLTDTERASGQPEMFGIAKKKNVIVLQVEALENFVINKEINNQEITPYMNKLSNEEIYFTNFYEQTALGRTSDAEFLLNTSLYPTASGSAYMLYSENQFDSLPMNLKNNGYSTNVFHAYNPSFWNRYIIYKQFGIDEFYSVDDFEDAEAIGWSINDESMLMQSLDKIKTMEEPFYSHLITLSSHHPFVIPEKYQTLKLEGYTSYSDRHFRNYIHSIHYVDQAIGKFIDEMKRTGLWDETVVLIYGDHNSGFMDEGNTFAQFSGADNPLALQEGDKSIPLFVHIPGEENSQVINHVAGQIDLGPTILDLVGIPTTNKYMLGENIFVNKDRQVTYRDGSFVTNDLLYDATPDGIYDNGKCYDRESRQEIDTTLCKSSHELGIKELRISDDILDGNLILEILNLEK